MRTIRRATDSGGRTWAGYYRFRRQDGSYASVLDHGYILHNSEGKPARVVGGIRDITERRRGGRGAQEFPPAASGSVGPAAIRAGRGARERGAGNSRRTRADADCPEAQPGLAGTEDRRARARPVPESAARSRGRVRRDDRVGHSHGAANRHGPEARRAGSPGAGGCAARGGASVPKAERHCVRSAIAARTS